MRTRVWMAACLFGLGAGTAIAQTPAASQTPTGPMSGMGMSQGACMGMPMGGGGSMAMDHGSGKAMDMGKGAEMGGMAMGKSVIPTGPMKITFGEKSSEWTPATLSALPHKTFTLWNEHAKACQTYSGVELIELLKPLGVAEKPHGKDLRLYTVVEGADGYQAVFSVGEVTPDVHDGTVMVADTMDGKGLGDSGPLQLVATGEKRPARWVRNLAAIRVKTAE